MSSTLSLWSNVATPTRVLPSAKRGEVMFVSKKDERRYKKLLKEFLPTMGLTWDDYVLMNKLEKEAVLQAFRSWLRKKKEK